MVTWGDKRDRDGSSKGIFFSFVGLPFSFAIHLFKKSQRCLCWPDLIRRPLLWQIPASNWPEIRIFRKNCTKPFYGNWRIMYVIFQWFPFYFILIIRLVLLSFRKTFVMKWFKICPISNRLSTKFYVFILLLYGYFFETTIFSIMFAYLIIDFCPYY